MAAPISRDPVMSAISVASPVSASGASDSVNSGAFEGELKQASQPREKSVASKNEVVNKDSQQEQKPDKSSVNDGKAAETARPKDKVETADLAAAQENNNTGSAGDIASTDTENRVITSEDIATSFGSTNIEGTAAERGTILPFQGGILPLDMEKALAPAVFEPVSPAIASVPESPLAKALPIDDLASVIGASKDLSSNKTVANDPAVIKVATPVVSAIPAAPITPIAAPIVAEGASEKPVVPALNASGKPELMVTPNSVASPPVTEAALQSAASAISARDTNAASQSTAVIAEATKNPQSAIVPAAQSVEVAPVIAKQESVSIDKVVQTVPDLQPIAPQVASSVGTQAIVVDEPLLVTTPITIATATAKLDPAPVVAQQVQSARVNDTTVEQKALKAESVTQSKVNVGAEQALSISAAPAPLAVQPVINPAINPTDNLNLNLQQLRAGIDVSVKSVVEGAESAEVTSAKSASVDSIQQLTSLQNNLRTTSPVQMQLPVGTPPGSQNWGRAVADKVMIAASQNLRVANIHLDPPELGALQIRLQIGQDQQVNISFTSPAGTVRDALEQQMPRLREMLEEQGINLGQSDVKDQGGKSDGEGGDSSPNGSYASSEGEGAEQNSVMLQRNLALVDYYA